MRKVLEYQESEGEDSLEFRDNDNPSYNSHKTSVHDTDSSYSEYSNPNVIPLVHTASVSR